jgi:hypothetical protein
MANIKPPLDIGGMTSSKAFPIFAGLKDWVCWWKGHEWEDVHRDLLDYKVCSRCGASTQWGDVC